MSKNKFFSVIRLKFWIIKTTALSAAKSLLALIPKFSISFTVEHPMAHLEKVDEDTNIFLLSLLLIFFESFIFGKFLNL